VECYKKFSPISLPCVAFGKAKNQTSLLGIHLQFREKEVEFDVSVICYFLCFLECVCEAKQNICTEAELKNFSMNWFRFARQRLEREEKQNIKIFMFVVCLTLLFITIILINLMNKYFSK